MNYAGICNDQVDKDLNVAKVTADVEIRKKLYDHAQSILQDELPIIYLYH